MDTTTTPEVQIASEASQGSQISQTPQPAQPSQSSQNIQSLQTPDVDMNGTQDTTNDRNGEKKNPARRHPSGCAAYWARTRARVYTCRANGAAENECRL